MPMRWAETGRHTRRRILDREAEVQYANPV
jgi:hypothetical protein